MAETSPQPLKTRRPSKTPAILAIATTTPATPPEIADAVKVSRQAVHEVLNRYGIKANTVGDYKAHRADILAAAQEKDVKVYLSLDEEERKKLIMRRGMVDVGILYDKERLERDLSTQNIQPMVSFSNVIDVTPEVTPEDGPEATISDGLDG